MKGKYYLSPEDQTTSDFIHDVLVGMKKLQVLKFKDVIMTQVSQIAGLKVNQILEEARKYLDIDNYMPDLKDGKLQNRNYVINVVNTILPDQLQEMVDNATAQREMKFIKMRNLTMKVLPEFIQMFSESKELSRQNGRFHQLVRNTEARRAKKEGSSRHQMVDEEIEEETYDKDEIISEHTS